MSCFMKKILVINSGSSSLKYQLFETDGAIYRVVIKGIAERIGINGSNISYHTYDGMKECLDIPLVLFGYILFHFILWFLKCWLKLVF